MIDDIPAISPSAKAIEEADFDPNEFSGHGHAIGAAGYKPPATTPEMTLAAEGDRAIIDPQDHGFAEMRVGLAWDNVTGAGIDLDIGILYELADGQRGAVQAFGKRFGAFDAAPFVALSGDERTGDALGEDEFIRINGAQWPQIARLLIYIYIYGGAEAWAGVRPHVTLRVPGHDDVVAAPDVEEATLPICAVVGLENVRNGIKIDYYGEYFPGHIEMDRAFGFGVAWEDGKKDGDETGDGKQDTADAA